MKIKSLSYIQQCDLIHLIVVRIEENKLACVEDVYQSDRGTLESVNIVGDIVEFFEKNNLIEKDE